MSLRTLSSSSKKLAGCSSPVARAVSRTYASSPSSSAHASDYAVSTASGVKIASLDDGSPTSAITVAIKAGPRYEPAPGLAHVLKNFVFKSTAKRSALRLTREVELLGGVLSSSLSREHLFLTAEFLRGDEPYFAELLGDVLVQSGFKPHEYNEEVIPAVAGDYDAAASNPRVLAMDLAHQLAFRRGLGNSLFASPYVEVDVHSAVAFGRSSFANPDGIAVLATGGLDQKLLSDLVGQFYVGSTSSASSSSPSAVQAGGQSSYYGGEMRIPATGHGHGQVGHLVVGFQGASHSSPEFAVLKALLGGEAATKWGTGTQPFAKLSSNVSSGIPAVRAFNLAYSDAGLFGFTVDAKTDKIAGLAKEAVAAIKNIADKGASEEEFQRALARAKFEAAAGLEGRITKQEVIGAQILESGKFTSLAEAFKALDGVTASKVQEAAKTALKSKPTTVSVGDTHKLPYSDELGL